MSNLITAEVAAAFEESKQHYLKNRRVFQLFYYPMNKTFPFLFDKKIEEYEEKTETFYKVIRQQTKLLHQRVAHAYVTKNYTHNAFQHFIFDIDGSILTYSIVELEMYGIIDTADSIRYKLVEVEKQKEIPNNVLQFKR